MVSPGAAPGFEHRDAVHLRQAEIEDHRVVGLGLAEIVALLAVEGAVDGIAGVAQRGHELAIQVGIVLDNEKSQGLPRQRSTTLPLVASTVVCVTLPSLASTVST